VNSKTEYLTFNTNITRAFIKITQDVRRIVEESKIKEGLCLVNAMHITASIFINDKVAYTKILIYGLKKWLHMAPIKQYRHNETGEV
jgi:thiamine phosphate synthase YjbQ (UPF0047 family)